MLRRDELENELFELCRRLRRPPAPIELGAAQPLEDAEPRRRHMAGPAPRRCYIASNHCADFDFPRLLEAEERLDALLRALNETASLLYYFARTEQGAERRNRHLPS